MQNLAKKKTTFSRDIPFISTCFIVNTSKCKILQKRQLTFSRDIPFISTCFIVHTSKCKILQKRKRLFARYSFISTCFIVHTSKCRILQKRKRLFREIFHLLVHVSILILINAESCKKENDFFARYSIY